MNFTGVVNLQEIGKHICDNTFDSLYCPEGRVFVQNDCPGARVFAPFKSCPKGGRWWLWMKLIPA